MLEKIKEYWSIFISHFSISSNRKVLGFIGLVVVVVTLPLTVIVSQQQQETRQRAEGFEITPPYLPPTSTPSITPIPTPLSTSSSVTVLSPSRGEKWQIGSNYFIKWQSTGIDKLIINLINYSCSSELFTTIATNITASQGNYSWKIPDNILNRDSRCSNGQIGWKSGGNFKIFIAQLKSNGEYGIQNQSSGYFSIVAAPTSAPALPKTKFNLDLILMGIGKGNGDNSNPISKSRDVTVELFSSQSVYPKYTATGTVNYDKTTGTFKGTAELSYFPTSGNYTLAIKASRYERKRANSSQAQYINSGTINQLSQVQLIVGDTNTDGIVDLGDEYTLTNCIKKTSSFCMINADLTDDGKIDTADVSLWRKGYSLYYNSNKK